MCFGWEWDDGGIGVWLSAVSSLGVWESWSWRLGEWWDGTQIEIDAHSTLGI